MTRAAIVSVSHGAGPLPILGHPSQGELVNSMKTKARNILRLNTPEAPRAIILITAHWETDVPTISGGRKPPLLYDYYGFPPEAYEIKYPGSGSPEIAKEIYTVLDKAGLSPKIDTERGWDHGVFIPMSIINPSANIPIIQMSILSTNSEPDSTAKLFKMGKALAQLRDSNIAIVGSGLYTFHNLQGIRTPGWMADKESIILQWSEALTAAVLVKNLTEREKAVGKWRTFAGSEISHPKGGADHLFPLFACAGAAGDGPGSKWVDSMMGQEIVSYYWE